MTPKKADIGSKRLVSLSPEKWVKWVLGLPDVQVIDVLSSEFQWIGKEGDVLIKACTPEGQEFLIVNEIQLHYTATMPRRIRAYAALAEEKYNLPVYPILVNILEPSASNKIVSQYKSEFLGLQAIQDYRVINLWEIEVDLVFERSLLPLLPFVPILKGGGEEAKVQQALNLLRDDPQLSELENLLAFFATFVLDTELVQQIMRWDMAVLRQSPWYQEIEQKGMALGMQEGMALGMQEGIALGMQEGIALGKQEGIALGLLTGLEVALEVKFGDEGVTFLQEVRERLSRQDLETMSRVLKTASSLAELRQILNL